MIIETSRKMGVRMSTSAKSTFRGKNERKGGKVKSEMRLTGEEMSKRQRGGRKRGVCVAAAIEADCRRGKKRE
jgi:hypothetical protein